jgi:hypothetical protein
MELSPSWEAASRWATQEFPNILWNPKVHYHVYKNIPFHTTPSYLSNINFNIILHQYLSLHSDLFPSGFPTKILYAFIFCPMRATIHIEVKLSL